MLIIGNKPYRLLDMNPILDSYPSNTRCNMALPNRNNGTICDQWALCNHLYGNVIINKTEINKFKKIYHKYKSEKIDDFFKDINKYKNLYKRIYHAKNSSGKLFNTFLKGKGSPYSFSKLPRTGYTSLFENLLKGEYVSVFGFSVINEVRSTYYVKEGEEENLAYHSKEEELLILNWLHNNNIIDATLCFLIDEKIPTISCVDIKPTKKVIDKLINLYDKCYIIGYDIDVDRYSEYNIKHESDKTLLYKKQ